MNRLLAPSGILVLSGSLLLGWAPPELHGLQGRPIAADTTSQSGDRPTVEEPASRLSCQRVIFGGPIFHGATATDPAQKSRLSIRIHAESTGRPIGGAFLTVIDTADASTRLRISADSLGRASIFLPEGSYEVRIGAVGWRGVGTRIDLERGEQLQMFAGLYEATACHPTEVHGATTRGEWRFYR